MKHQLKILDEHFDAIFENRKFCEIRKNDRNYSVRDLLYLIPESYKTVLVVRVSHIDTYAQVDDHVVMSIEIINIISKEDL